ncbi:hypothetical protein CRENBAI_018012 [Crenichthys baileyi]|uniref:Immunoglobulin I-set domain-containing protein n=1 Tax=Crenichthys baileyi TaxID=28760 RepID=A0AAV9SHG9_9TELE
MKEHQRIYLLLLLLALSLQQKGLLLEGRGALLVHLAFFRSLSLTFKHKRTRRFRFQGVPRLSNTQGINIQILGGNTILMIANVTEEDYGNYTCVASNRLGTQSASVFLYSEY